MKLNLLFKLAVQNMKAMKEVLIPYLIAVSTMFGLEYILLSLISNEYINERHTSLPQLISYANTLTAFLTIIFILYANNFIIKRRRQEFALKMVLGMEKKHLTVMHAIEKLFELLICAVLAITGGYLFGNLIFMILNRLVESKGIKMMNYPFDMNAARITLLMLTGIIIVMFVLNMILILFQSPIKLLRTKKSGEKKTKTLLLMIFLIIGIVTLGYGYYTAVSIDGILSSLAKIFFAVLAVTIGTYFLFMSLTIFVLQWLQKMPSFYYSSNNFLSISGLLSRMKANAIGLASIAMLCTFLVVTLGMSLTAYRGTENQIANSAKQDYSFAVEGKNKAERNKQIESIKQDIEKYADVDRFRSGETTMVGMYNDNGHMKVLNQSKSPAMENILYAMIITEKGHNDLNDSSVHIQDKDDVIVSTNTKKYGSFKTLNVFNGEKKHVTHVPEDFLGSKLAVDALYIIVKDEKELVKYPKYYKRFNMTSSKYETDNTYVDIAFNVKGDKEKFNKQIPMLKKKYDIEIMSKAKVSKFLYELNGGLIFIGIVVSIVMLIGMFLILYYKQISEGYDDKENYSIMKKVGLPQSLIKKTINKQIFWVFGLPLIVAVIHTMVASKIIFTLLGVIGVRDWWMFATSYLSVLVVIMIVYGLMYLITSSTYYRLVNQEK